MKTPTHGRARFKRVGIAAFAVLAMAVPVRPVQADEILIFASRVTRLALAELGPAFRQATGHTLVVTEDVAVVMQRRIQAGERFDLAVLVDYQTDALIKAGLLTAGTRTDIMRSGIGLSVKAGATRPDISSPDALKAALLAAPSLTFLAEGASTRHVDRVFDQLGVADAVRAKTVRVPTDTVAEQVADGKAAIGIGIIANILSVPGVDLVGPFPPPLQYDIVFTAATATNTAHRQAAQDVIDLLTSPAGRAAIRERGMDPG